MLQSVRGAFEYQGQKCSALSRLYVSASLWEGGFKDGFLKEIAKIKVGPPQDFGNFLGPVMCAGISVVNWVSLTLLPVESRHSTRLLVTSRKQKKQVEKS